MSEEDSAQKLFDDLGSLSEELLEVYNSADHICGEGARNAVWRNSQIATMRYADKEALKERVEQLVMSLTHDDGSFLQTCHMHAGDVAGAKSRVEELKTRFSALWNSQAKQVDHLSSSLKGERSKVTQLTARLSEHAINRPDVRDKVWAITDGRCFYCEIELTRERCADEPNRCFHVEHIVAKSNGGPDHISNYVPSCHRCNMSKGTKPFAEFIVWLESQKAPGLKVVGGSDMEEPF
jgi:5-methylcytosine-specific restriction endonuclease McrA